MKDVRKGFQISKEQVDSQLSEWSILFCILDNQEKGIWFNEILRRVGLSHDVVRKHLKKLENKKRVYHEGEGRGKRKIYRVTEDFLSSASFTFPKTIPRNAYRLKELYKNPIYYKYRLESHSELEREIRNHFDSLRKQ